MLPPGFSATPGFPAQGYNLEGQTTPGSADLSLSLSTIPSSSLQTAMRLERVWEGVEREGEGDDGGRRREDCDLRKIVEKEVEQ